MSKSNVTVSLSVKQRYLQIEIPSGTKQIHLEVSRIKCKDVLLEVVDEKGQAKGKPLEKWLPVIKQKGIYSLRFLMNDFSTQPINIDVLWS